MFRYSCLSPSTGATIRNLAKLRPRTLALMHGSSYAGDTEGALLAMADYYDQRIDESWKALRGKGRTAP
jgi:hypothetical protein